MQTPLKPYRRERPSTPAPYGSTRPVVPPGGSLYFKTVLPVRAACGGDPVRLMQSGNIIAETLASAGKMWQKIDD